MFKRDISSGGLVESDEEKRNRYRFEKEKRKELIQIKSDLKLIKNEINSIRETLKELVGK